MCVLKALFRYFNEFFISDRRVVESIREKVTTLSVASNLSRSERQPLLYQESGHHSFVMSEQTFYNSQTVPRTGDVPKGPVTWRTVICRLVVVTGAVMFFIGGVLLKDSLDRSSPASMNKTSILNYTLLQVADL